MVLGEKLAIFDWEWGRIQPLEKDRKCPGTQGVILHEKQTFNLNFAIFPSLWI